ncbi:MAG: 2'-5' RNA ligase family protein [Actinomycetes bacterium]
MALAVCLLFDRRGDLLVRRIWSRLEARGVRTPLSHTHRRHRPHLSLAVARTWDLDSVFEAVAALPRADPTELSIQGTVTFPRGRSALAAAVSGDLVRRQEAAVRAVEQTGADVHRHYEPGRWLPHVSVATGGSAEGLAVVATTVNDALPISVNVTWAALVDSGTGEAWPLPTLV